MQTFRTRNIAIICTAIVCLGLLAGTMRVEWYLNSSRSFAEWLTSVILKDQQTEITDELYQLGREGKDLYTTVSRASEIVSKYDTAFSFAIPGSKKSGEKAQIFNLLITQWNSAEAHNTMADVPLRTLHNFLKSLHLSDLNAQSYFSSLYIITVPHYFSEFRGYFSILPWRWTLPFLNGVAIGAP